MEILLFDSHISLYRLNMDNSNKFLDIQNDGVNPLKLWNCREMCSLESFSFNLGSKLIIWTILSETKLYLYMLLSASYDVRIIRCCGFLKCTDVILEIIKLLLSKHTGNNKILRVNMRCRDNLSMLLQTHNYPSRIKCKLQSRVTTSVLIAHSVTIV